MHSDDHGAADAVDSPARTSEVLRDLAYSGGERVTFGEILANLRQRAFGFAMLIFSLPSVLPMPPGIPTVCGAAARSLGGGGRRAHRISLRLTSIRFKTLIESTGTG